VLIIICHLPIVCSIEVLAVFKRGPQKKKSGKKKKKHLQGAARQK
jgi:hypothetical protein